VKGKGGTEQPALPADFQREDRHENEQLVMIRRLKKQCRPQPVRAALDQDLDPGAGPGGGRPLLEMLMRVISIITNRPRRPMAPIAIAIPAKGS